MRELSPHPDCSQSIVMQPEAISALTILFEEWHRREPWRARAACRGLTPEQASRWFHPINPDEATPGYIFCGRCPVQAECLEAALAQERQYGIWGCMSEKDRRRLKAEMRADG